jgi:hydroxymethylbilane synthase
MTDILRIATRGSELARRQAATVRDGLAGPRRDVELVEVETRGDRIREELIHRLGRTGAFVRALDERVLSGEADAAVHSLKDVPTEGLDGLTIAAVPERAPAGDVLVTPDGGDLDDLEAGAVVGTASLRRAAQLRAARPDPTVEPIRGNVDTRLEKLLAPSRQREHEHRLAAAGELDAAGESSDDGAGGDDDAPAFEQSPDDWFDSLSELERRALGREVETEYDALVLAEAGLRRSGLDGAVPTSRLPRSEFVPAAGQGAIAVTAAADGGAAGPIRNALDHPRSRAETTVERVLLAELGGGCIAPIGVWAVLRGEYVHARVRVLSTDGRREVADTRDLPVESHADAARAFAADLADRGADDLIRAARREGGDGDAALSDDEDDEDDGRGNGDGGDIGNGNGTGTGAGNGVADE